MARGRTVTRLLKLPLILPSKVALVSAVGAFLFLVFQPALFAQGGYDTTDMAKPEEAEDGNKRDPDEYERARREEQEKAGQTKTYAPAKEVNDLEKWFSQYDDIRRKYENTPDERQYFEQLANRAPGSGLSDDDRKFLHDMAQRYSEAFNQLREVEACSETQHLHRGYGSFLAQQSNVYSEYIRILGEPSAVDPRTGRPLVSGMTDKRRYLYNLEKTNHMLDMRTRETYKIGRNPYEPKERPPE